ncbi:MAG: prolyl oligopeptidase family serine peptidase [Deltaproteobacteria bacterium]
MKRTLLLLGVVLLAVVAWALWPDPSTCDEPPLPSMAAELFDLDVLRDPSTLGFEVLATDRLEVEGERVVVRRVRFTSFDWIGCRLAPVEVEGYLALPSSAMGTRSGRLPGLVRMHGLHPLEEKASAAAWAAEGFAALASFTPNDGPDDTFTGSPRGGFFFRHTVAAIRGLTVLAAQPEVDTTKLALHGLSAGGIVNTLVGAMDDRVKATTAWFSAGHGALGAAAKPNPAWTAIVLASMTPARGYDAPEWSTHLEWYDPARHIRAGHPATLLIEGARDPFFPIDMTVATVRDLEGANVPHRLDVIDGFDHQPRADVDAEVIVAQMRSTSAWWLRRRLFAPERVLPSVTATIADGRLVVDAPGATSLVLYASDDAARSFRATKIDALTSAPTGVWFVRARFEEGGRVVYLTSVPVLPPGFSPFVSEVTSRTP